MDGDQKPSNKVFGIPYRIFVPAAALIVAAATVLVIRHSFAPRDEAEGISPAKQRLVKRDISRLREAVRQDPHSWEAHYRLGRAMSSAGREGEAIEHLRRASEINRQERRPLLELGRSHGRLGLFDESIDFYRQALKMNPDDAEAAGELALVERRRREAIEGGVYSGIAGIIAPPVVRPAPAEAPGVEPETMPPARVEAAPEGIEVEIGAAPGEEIEVEVETEEPVAIVPDGAALESMLPPEGAADPLLFSEGSVEIYVELGRLNNATGQFTIAAQLFSRALDKEPENPLANFGLGISYLGLDNRPAATAQYLILLALDPVLADRLLAEINK